MFEHFEPDFWQHKSALESLRHNVVGPAGCCHRSVLHLVCTSTDIAWSWRQTQQGGADAQAEQVGQNVAEELPEIPSNTCKQYTWNQALCKSALILSIFTLSANGNVFLLHVFDLLSAPEFNAVLS